MKRIRHDKLVYVISDYVTVIRKTEIKLEKAAQGVLPSAKYRPTRLVVDAALRRIGKTRR